jgi:hypothetical protein
MSFCLSFHLAPFGPTEPHWLDDPPDLSCKDDTQEDSLEGWRLSCKTANSGSSATQAFDRTPGHASELCSLLVEPDGRATLQARWPRAGRRPRGRRFIGRSSRSRPRARCRRDTARQACTSTPGPCRPAPVGPPRPARGDQPDSGGTERRPGHARTRPPGRDCPSALDGRQPPRQEASATLACG